MINILFICSIFDRKLMGSGSFGSVSLAKPGIRGYFFVLETTFFVFFVVVVFFFFDGATASSGVHVHACISNGKKRVYTIKSQHMIQGNGKERERERKKERKTTLCRIFFVQNIRKIVCTGEIYTQSRIKTKYHESTKASKYTP